MIVKDISEMKEMPPRMDEHGAGEEREDDGEECNGHGGEHHQHHQHLSHVQHWHQYLAGCHVVHHGI